MLRTVILLSLPTVGFVALSACDSDHGISGLCGVPQSGFDITEASTLQDSQSYPNMHDAVVLNFEGASELTDDAVWRVRSVEIMPLIGASSFDFAAEGGWVTVEVWDADNPLAVEPWRVQQQFFKDEHEWTDTRLSNPESTFELDQKQTWWRFGFEDIIPMSGMASANYLVGVSWDSGSNPPLGYSNFNRPCSRNWTDYADGFGWILNQDNGPGGTCSWPMLRVNLEVITPSDHCEGEDYSIE